MQKFLEDKKLAIIISVSIIVFIVIAVTLPLFNSFFIADEALIMPYLSTCKTISNDSFLQIYTASNHSWFLMSLFFVEFSRYLPKLLNLHPQICVQLVTSKVFIGIFLIFLFALTNNFFKYQKTKLFYAPVLLCVFIFVMSMYKKAGFLWSFSNVCWFWSYVFLPVSAIILFSYLEKYYVLQQKPTKREWFSIISLVFLVAIGHEFFRFILLLGVFLALIFDKIFIKTDFSLKKFLLYFLSTTFLCSLTTLTFTYKNWVESRVYTFSPSDLLPYLSQYFQNIIVNKFSIYFLLATLLILILFFVNNKKQNERLINYVVSFAISLFIFMFVIVFGKDTTDYANPLAHSGLQFLFVTTFLSLILSASGYLLAFNDLSIKSKKTLSIVLIFLGILCLADRHTFDFDEFQKYAQERREIMYIFEKTYLLSKPHKVLYSPLNPSSFHAQYYLDDTYFNIQKPDLMDTIVVCKPKDSFASCKDKFLAVAKKDLGYSFTNEELRKMNFTSLEKFNK